MNHLQAVRRKLLFLARDHNDFDLVRDKVATCSPPVDVHATRRTNEALTALRQVDFDAALCAVSREDDVAQVIRMKKAAPGAPLLALVDGEDSELASLSIRMGATGLICRSQDSTVVARLIVEAMQMRALTAKMAVDVVACRQSAREMRGLAETTRILAASAMNRVRQHPGDGFQPLLLEDDANDELMFSLSLRRAGLRRRIPTVRSVEEAVQYLRGVGEFGDRIRFPVPSLVILDFHVGGGTSEEVLRLIRCSPAYRSLPVVLLSSTENPAEIAAMESLGINLRIVKPHSILELDSAVEVILDFWRIWSLQGGA